MYTATKLYTTTRNPKILLIKKCLFYIIYATIQDLKYG